MSTEEGDSDDPNRRTINGLRIIAGIILFPFLWIGIAINFLGIAEKLSFLPGISRDGGLLSATIALLVTAGILVTVVVGAASAIGGGFPMIGHDENRSTATPTTSSTPTPIITQTATGSQTESPTSTPTPSSQPSDLQQFKKNFNERLRYSVVNETFTPIPVLATEYRETTNGTIELWMIYRECNDFEKTWDQRHSTAVAFANVAGGFRGNKPDQLRAYGVNSLESYPSAITNIPTLSAEAAFNKSMNRTKYEENWQSRLHVPNETETEIAYQMVINDSGPDKAEQVFYEQYPLEESDGDCHVPPEDGEKTGTDGRISNNGVSVAAEPIAP